MCVLTYSQSLTQQQLRRGESERGSRGRGRMGQHPSLAGRGSLGGRNIKRMACAVQDYDGAAAGGGVECSFLGLVPPSLLPPSFLLRLLRDFTYAGSDAPSPPTPSSEFKLQASRLSFAGAAPTAPWRLEGEEVQDVRAASHHARSSSSLAPSGSVFCVAEGGRAISRRDAYASHAPRIRGGGLDRDPDLIPGDVRRCLERARGPVRDDVCATLLSHPCRCCRAGRAGRAQAYVRVRLRLLRVATQRWTCTHAVISLTFMVH